MEKEIIFAHTTQALWNQFTRDDQSDLGSVSYVDEVSAHTWDESNGWGSRVDSYNFEAKFDNGEVININITKAYDFDKAQKLASDYAESLGVLPIAVRMNMDTVNVVEYLGVNKATFAAGANNTVHFSQEAADASSGSIEEVLIHEAGHLIPGAYSEEYRAAVEADSAVVSGYANTNISEDFSETFTAYLAVKMRSDDLDPELLAKFQNGLANRFEYFDSLDLPLGLQSDEGETVVGDESDDQVDGTWGDDTINAGAGKDVVNAGSGNDIVYGGEDNDTLRGEVGLDQLYGGAGNDTIDGGKGNDKIYGEAGDDTLNGGNGRDIVSGGDGKDVIAGGEGNDLLNGNDGDDTLDGGIGNDLIGGDWGNDTLSGGEGNDTLWGGYGEDKLDGGNGNDTLYGNQDNDIIKAGNGNDTAYGGTGNDKINGDNGNDIIEGGNGNDLIGGDNGHDKLYGGEGNDEIWGGWDNDQLSGDQGNDWLHGGHGNDIVAGGAGNDTIVSGLGDDVVYGGQGLDTFEHTGQGGKMNIKDFQSGQDKIDVTAMDMAYKDMKMSQTNEGVSIDLGDNGSIMIDDMKVEDIKAEDFAF